MKKPNRKPKQPAKRRIRIDISDWDLGDWPTYLWKSVEVEKRYYCIDLSIDNSIFEPMARKIAHEAIETFLNDAHFDFDKNGIRVSDINFEPQFTISLDRVYVINQKAADVMKKHIDSQLALLDLRSRR